MASYGSNEGKSAPPQDVAASAAQRAALCLKMIPPHMDALRAGSNRNQYDRFGIQAVCLSQDWHQYASKVKVHQVAVAARGINKIKYSPRQPEQISSQAIPFSTNEAQTVHQSKVQSQSAAKAKEPTGAPKMKGTTQPKCHI